MNSQVRNQSIAAIIIIFVCCVAIFLFGCAENPAAPSSNNSNDVTFDNTTATGDVTKDAEKDKDKDSDAFDTVFVAADTVVGLVHPLGDTLVLHIQGKMVTFIIPAGAVLDTVTITIIGSRYITSGNMDLYTYECGPSGLQFAIPLQLTQLINRTDGAEATFWYFDESLVDGDGTGWESIGVSSILGGRGTFLISHFSKYGVSYGISNGGQYGDVVVEEKSN